MTRVAFEKIKPLIAEIVEQKLVELLGDPDAHLELRPEIKTRLRKALNRRELIPAEKVAKQLGLKW